MQKEKIKISISTLGCKVNQYDSSAMNETLLNCGYEIVPFDASADVYIINTCVVTSKTEAQSRRLIRNALRRNPLSYIIATGCYAQKSSEDLTAISDRIHILGNRGKDDISLHLLKILKGDTLINAASDISLEKTFTTPACSSFLDRTRAFLKIQDGCDSRCSYCIVPSVRGPSRSLPIKDVESRLHMLAQKGYLEVVLTGIHLGAYGVDLVPQTTICEILGSLEKEEFFSHLRIRLSSIEPAEFTDDLISFLSQSKLICPHFHIPLQSGDPTILREMGRQYTHSFYNELIQRLTSRIPDLNIGVDIIAGFPGETDEKFYNTVEFVKSLPIGYLHVFPYSSRKGTAAERLSNQVPEHIKKQRCKILINLSIDLKHRFYSSYLNKDICVLAEGKKDKETNKYKGFSKNYIPVYFEGDDSLTGKEVKVKIIDVKADKVSGSLAG